MGGSGRRAHQWVRVNGERLHGLHYWSRLDDGRLLIDTHVLLPAPGAERDAAHTQALVRPGLFADAPEGSTFEVELEVHGLSGSGVADFTGRRLLSFASSWIRRDGRASRRRIDRYIVWPVGMIIGSLEQVSLRRYQRFAAVEQEWDGADLGSARNS
jgi:hypothetical protein